MKILKLSVRILAILAILVSIGYFGDIQKIKAQSPECDRISGIDYIPSYCDYAVPEEFGGYDGTVIVKGATIDMSKEKVWQTTKDGHSKGQKCDDPNNTDCDSRRHFKNLFLKRGARLTHAEIKSEELAPGGPKNQDTNGDQSLADEATGTARWKKIDLLIDDDIYFQTGGNINVSGKGYPGGYAMVNPGAGVFFTEKGWGPGGGTNYGHWERHHDVTMAAGGGYGGKGGDGYTDPHGGTGPLIPGGIINPQASTYKGDKTDLFEFGSGGGSAAERDGGDYAWSNGGAGGGRVRIETTRIFFGPDGADKSIQANGSAGENMYDGDGGVTTGGGGSGGTIWFNGNIIYRPQRTDRTSVDGKQRGTVGTINSPDSNTFGFHADGGDGGGLLSPRPEHRGVGGGGGGRIVINVATSLPPGPGECTPESVVVNRNIGSRNVEVIVEWSERGDTKKVQLNTILRNMVKTTTVTPPECPDAS